MKLETKKRKDDILEVTAEIPLLKERVDERQKLYTADIQKELEKQGFLLDKCLKHATISNVAEHKRRGTWLFKLKPKPKKKKKLKDPVKKDLAQDTEEVLSNHSTLKDKDKE